MHAQSRTPSEAPTTFNPSSLETALKSQLQEAARRAAAQLGEALSQAAQTLDLQEELTLREAVHACAVGVINNFCAAFPIAPYIRDNMVRNVKRGIEESMGSSSINPLPTIINEATSALSTDTFRGKSELLEGVFRNRGIAEEEFAAMTDEAKESIQKAQQAAGALAQLTQAMGRAAEELEHTFGKFERETFVGGEHSRPTTYPLVLELSAMNTAQLAHASTNGTLENSLTTVAGRLALARARHEEQSAAVAKSAPNGHSAEVKGNRDSAADKVKIILESMEARTAEEDQAALTKLLNTDTSEAEAVLEGAKELFGRRFITTIAQKRVVEEAGKRVTAAELATEEAKKLVKQLEAEMAALEEQIANSGTLHRLRLDRKETELQSKLEAAKTQVGTANTDHATAAAEFEEKFLKLDREATTSEEAIYRTAEKLSEAASTVLAKLLAQHSSSHPQAFTPSELKAIAQAVGEDVIRDVKAHLRSKGAIDLTILDPQAVATRLETLMLRGSEAAQQIPEGQSQSLAHIIARAVAADLPAPTHFKLSEA